MQVKLRVAVALLLTMWAVGGAAAAASDSTGPAAAMQPDRRAAFLAYVEHRHRPAFSFIDSYGLVIGKRIRDSGIAYYKVPPGFGLGRYRYTIVNDQVVLVEPGTHRIVDIFE